MGSENATGAGNQQGRPIDVDRNPQRPYVGHPMTRAEALATGSKRYHGRPCKGCGGTERYTKGGCIPCGRGTARERYRDRRTRLDGWEFVYECYSPDDELLYIGRTNHPHNRVYTHRQESPWWSEVDRVLWLQVPDVERQHIIAKQPKYNKHGAPTG